MTDLNRKLRWLIALRLLIVVSITVAYGLYRLGDELNRQDSSPPGAEAAKLTDAEQERQTLRDHALINLTFLASVQTLLYIGLQRFLEQRPTVQAYIQFVGDLLLVTRLMYQMGPAGQSFSILYFVVISVASVILRRSAGIVVATLASLLFTVMIWSPEWPPLKFVLTRLGLVSLSPSPLVDLTILEKVYGQLAHVAGFYAVAVLTSYLARDITRAEERLRAKQFDLAYLEVVHRDVVQSITSGLVTTDLNGIVTSLNKMGEELFGVSAADLVGGHVAETGLFDEDRWRELTESTADGTTRTEIESHQDGHHRYLGLTLSHLRDADTLRRGYILLVADLTQERQLQKQLRLKDRMAAIGEMATKLAHEVGNPLAAISGSVQVLAGSLEAGASQAKLLEIILKESQRLDRTVKSFLQLASSRYRPLAPIDVAAHLAEYIELLRNSDEVHDGHRIEADLDPPSAYIRADPDQIGQIFWNLARNALQAMPGGGELRVKGRLEGGTYHLSFTDNGSGMTEQEKADLFHPFRSFFDKGTGIGMAIVYRIVQEHGGRISAESREGEGTVIRIELPVSGLPRGASPDDEDLAAMMDETQVDDVPGEGAAVSTTGAGRG